MAPPLFDNRYKVILWTIFLVLFAVSCIDPPYPKDFVLQHILTVVLLALLFATRRRWPLSNVSSTCIVVFLLLHLVGARYLYSNVPYDDWARSLFGQSLSEAFDWRRNHYDRLVHFGYGLLLAYPAREIAARYLRIPPVWSYFAAVDLVMSSSMCYELIEWGVAVLMSPEAAEAYNGQQGDIWDAQKDMALASCGALIAIVVTAIVHRHARLSANQRS